MGGAGHGDQDRTRSGCRPARIARKPAPGAGRSPAPRHVFSLNEGSVERTVAYAGRRRPGRVVALRRPRARPAKRQPRKIPGRDSGDYGVLERFAFDLNNPTSVGVATVYLYAQPDGGVVRNSYVVGYRHARRDRPRAARPALHLIAEQTARSARERDDTRAGRRRTAARTIPSNWAVTIGGPARHHAAAQSAPGRLLPKPGGVPNPAPAGTPAPWSALPQGTPPPSALPQGTPLPNAPPPPPTPVPT